MATPINRRAFLRQTATASAVAAAGVGAVTLATTAAGAAHPDAELLAFGVQFDAAIGNLRKAWALHDAAHAPVNALLGDGPFFGERYERWNVEWERNGCDTTAEACDAAHEIAQAICNRILATPASTIEGLAVRVRALRLDLGMDCNGDPREDWGYEKEATSDFFLEIERLALAGRA